MRRFALWAGLAGLAAAAPPGAAARPQEAPPTFSRDIAPLIYRRCTRCHRPGESAPFPLETYRHVRKRARQILEVVDQGLMPPWRPAPGYGEFRDERRLTPGERALLQRWVAGGAPQGDPAATPPPPRFAPGWQLGPPDQVVAMRRPYKVRAEGRDVFRNFVLPVGNREERWLAACELRTDNPRVLHHAFVVVDAQRRGRKLDGQDKGPGFGGLDFGAGDGMATLWAPGTQPHRFPAGTGLRLPPGSDVVVQLHLQPTGKPEQAHCRVGLFFHDRPPARAVTTVPLAIHALRIPAGATAYEARKTFTLPLELEVLAIFPHMHLLGREVQVSARRPGERGPVPLVWIRDWSFSWQDLYEYREPVRLPRGTKVDLRFVFDNSAGNPENPNSPPKVVRWGSQGRDEMALVILQAVEPPEFKHKKPKGFGRLPGGG